MKSAVKSLLKAFQTPIDFFFVILVTPAAYTLMMFRKIGASRLPKTTSWLKKIGIYPIRNHYYDPLFDNRQLTRPLDQDRSLPGIDLNVSGQIQFVGQLAFSKELIDLNLTERSNEPSIFSLPNGTFDSGDAEMLYQIIRHLKPRKVLEIGSGNSTLIAQLALKKNYFETNQTAVHICVEPYEQPWLEKLDGITLVRELIENCKIDWENSLDAGDLLFVDSSHMIRPQGDVLKEYLEIFPLLKPGVIIHIHDIFTPKDYLREWVVDEVRFWNEQYLLEALLTNSNRYEVMVAMNYLKNNHYADLKKVCPYLSTEREPGSFYIRVQP